MNAAVGDGSKNAILIFQTLVEKGYEAIKTGAVVRDLIHEMDIAIELAVQAIQQLSRMPSGSDIAAAAQTAAAGDAYVGDRIAEALAKSGPDGIVSLSEGSDATTALDIREGFYFDRGFLSTRFITDEGRQVAELSDALILICDSKLASIAKASLLVIAEDVEGEALETLALNKERGTLKCAAVRAPMSSQNREFMLEDIAVATGGTVISRFSLKLESVRLSQLGRAKRVEVTRDSCWIAGGGGDRQAVEARAEGIRRQISLEKGDYDIQVLHERLARLVGKVCAIRVGGASSLDRAERMYKMKSAMYSARQAIESGIVPGGGTVFLRVGQRLPNSSTATNAVAAALENPIRQQIVNARQDVREVLVELEVSEKVSIGFEAESRIVQDLDEAGIFDPTITSMRAVELAFVHARAILQTGSWDLTERDAELPRIGGAEESRGVRF
jgi:chaperonin GroEL